MCGTLPSPSFSHDNIRMKHLFRALTLAALVAFLGACSGSKNVLYLQNADSLAVSQAMLYDAKIMPKDELTITVNAINDEAVAIFNPTVRDKLQAGGKISGGGQGSLLPYLVDNAGNIDFPVVGKLHVAGLTKNQCQDMIRDKVKPYLADGETPLVLVRLSSYRVTVMGEVGSPRVIPVQQEKISIFEALTQAGDITIYGKRDNVLLIREDAAGQKTMHRLNLKDANVINSPFYYLQQNDIVYVEPSAVKANNSKISTSTTIWLSVAGTVMSLASLIISLTN